MTNRELYQLQVGQRVNVNPTYARYIGDKRIRIALATSKGWIVYTNVYGVIRKDMRKGRHTIWYVKWLGRKT